MMNSNHAAGWKLQAGLHAPAYRHQIAKLVGEFGPNAAVDNLQHLSFVICINWETQFIHNLNGIFQCFHIAPHNDSWVHIPF